MSKSFLRELGGDMKFSLALAVIAITGVALVISLADWLAWILIEHGEFMRRMAAEIAQGDNAWAYALAGVVALILFAVAVRRIVNIWK